MSWVAGPDMMAEDVELEEGEALYFNSNGDKSIDPDVALSYIDDKLQSVLGHFQKDFKGEFSDEKLGAIFGAYGSFLPMYQRSPLVLSQQKGPQTARSPDRFHREGAARSSSSSSSIPDTTLRQRDITFAPQVNLGDEIHRKEKDLSFELVAKNLPPRYEPSPNKSVNASDQKSLKFRIKVGSGKVSQKNVAIYSGLGLNSPSSSHGNSPIGGSVGVPCESREIFQESPTRILQMLSTLTDALGPLLSPLSDRFLNLKRDVPTGEKFDSKVVDDQVLNGRKKINTTVKCESVQENDILLRLKENSGAQSLDSSIDESQKLQSEYTNNTGGSLRNSSKQLGSLKGVFKGRLSGDDVVKDKSLDSTEKIVTKNPPHQIPESKRNEVNGTTFSSKTDFDAFESGRESKGSRMPDNNGKKMPPESKKKSKISQINGKVPLDSINGGRKDIYKGRDLYEDLLGYSIEKLSKDGSKGSIDTEKNESLQKLKTKTKLNKVNNQPTSESLIKEPPLNYNSPPENGLPLDIERANRALETEQTNTTAPVWIEDWVQCDRCEKWRLLPYGRKPDQLPEKWVCMKLDWLPGMNRCDITEEATTMALQASYHLPLPENQNLNQYNADRVLTEVNYAGNSDFISGNIANGSKNKHKVKGTSHKDSAARNSAESPVRRESLNGKKQPNSEVKSTSNNSIGQHRNCSNNTVEKHSTNQKLEHLTRGETKTKRKSKLVTDQYEQPIAKKVKTGRTLNIIDSPVSIGSLGKNDFHSNPSLPAVISMSDKRNPVEHSRTKDSKPEEVRQVEDTLFGGSLDTKRSSESHMSLKKRKLIDWQNSQSNVDILKNEGKIPPLVEEDSDSGVGRIKKPMVSHTKVNDDELTQKDTKKLRVSSQLSKADLESLKKALTSEQVPIAATSSSSKVSDSKTKAHKSSPVDSVCSSPLKMLTIDKLVVNRCGTFEGHGLSLTDEPLLEPSTMTIYKKYGKIASISPKDKERSSDFNSMEFPDKGFPPQDRQRTVKPKKNSRVIVEVDQSPVGRTFGLVKSSKVANGASKKIVIDKRENGLKRENQNSVVNLKDSCHPDGCESKIPQASENSREKHELLSTNIMMAHEHQKKNLPSVLPRDVSGCGEMSRELKDLGKDHSAPDGPSFSNSNASAVLQEAEGFRDYADRLKDTGFEYECNETYFQAALKYLQAASLLECSNGSKKHDKMNQTQIYINSAKLCQTCGEEYERGQEMAAAALAYKCMEVAYMRVVYCKNITLNRLCHDLQLSLRMVPQGESPLSSASDIDNLNNHANLVDKSSLSKTNATLLENHILASGSRSSFARLLDVSNYVNLAMEASMKYQNALETANIMLQKAQNKDGIVSVKRVIDFSFQDVDELVRLVELAKEAINCKAFCGSRN